MKSHALTSALLLLLAAPLGAEQIYKHVDERGRVTYSNEPIKGGKKVDLPPISTVSLPKPPPDAKPEAKAAADKAQQKKNLQDAIAAEEKALEKAKSKGSDKAVVTAHEKKLTELKAELGRLDAKP